MKPVTPVNADLHPAPFGPAALPTGDPWPTLRNLSAADLDAVMEIEPLAYPFPWSRGNVADSLGGAHRARGLFEADGRLVAYALAMPGVDEWHLLNLTVLPALHGLGLGRCLLDDLVEQARRDGSARVWLEVRASNDRARRLYERYGFEAVGLRRGYYPAGPGRREDAIVMRLDGGPLAPASEPEGPPR